MVVAQKRIKILEVLTIGRENLGDIIGDVAGRIPTIEKIKTLGLLNLVSNSQYS